MPKTIILGKPLELKSFDDYNVIKEVKTKEGMIYLVEKDGIQREAKLLKGD